MAPVIFLNRNKRVICASQEHPPFRWIYCRSLLVWFVARITTVSPFGRPALEHHLRAAQGNPCIHCSLTQNRVMYNINKALNKKRVMSLQINPRPPPKYSKIMVWGQFFAGSTSDLKVVTGTGFGLIKMCD